jgi:ubiquinone biosynthesis accessory factor UbiK
VLRTEIEQCHSLAWHDFGSREQQLMEDTQGMKPSDDFLDTLTAQINNLLSNGKQLGEDVRANLRGLIQSQLSKLDVVSREEFDTQQAILEKTRTQIDHLQKQLEQLESQLSPTEKS